MSLPGESLHDLPLGAAGATAHPGLTHHPAPRAPPGNGQIWAFHRERSSADDEKVMNFLQLCYIFT